MLTAMMNSEITARPLHIGSDDSVFLLASDDRGEPRGA
jgi:hypothetical protein